MKSKLRGCAAWRWAVYWRARAKRNGVLRIKRRKSARGSLFPSSACKFFLSRTCPIDGKLEQKRFQFWVALSLGEPCAIFGPFQALSRMFSHDRTVSAGYCKEIVGWAAGSVPLRL